MRQNAQLDLRIVGGKQQVARRRDECRAYLAPKFRAYRNVLQIWIGRAEPPRGRPCLAEASVQAARLGIDQPGQRVCIRRFQLGKLAVFENFSGQLV